MKLLAMLITISLAAPVKTGIKQLFKPCALCYKEYQECRHASVKSDEYSVEIEMCQDTYYLCFHKNKCNYEGSR